MEKTGISFEQWITAYGDALLAKHLKIHRHTVRLWRKGVCDPRVDHMRRIKRLSAGLIGYDQMIDRRVKNSKVRYPKGQA